MNLRAITLLFIYFFFVNTNAYAYLDPGTGSFILQVIIGFLAAASASFIYYWSKVKNFLSKIFKKNNKDEKTNNTIHDKK